jgi:4a-hydroxytetrahydrobiopterin dehydratase
MSHLADRTCVPCKGAVPPLERTQADDLLAQVGDEWQVLENGHLFLEKTYRFKDFAQALEFVNRIGELAEAQGHHPDVYLSWGKVRLQIWTHKIKGLTESDFVFAAKCDRAF